MKTATALLFAFSVLVSCSQPDRPPHVCTTDDPARAALRLGRDGKPASLVATLGELLASLRAEDANPVAGPGDPSDPLTSPTGRLP